jgi:hypothetical protein
MKIRERARRAATAKVPKAPISRLRVGEWRIFLKVVAWLHLSVERLYDSGQAERFGDSQRDLAEFWRQPIRGANYPDACAGKEINLCPVNLSLTNTGRGQKMDISTIIALIAAVTALVGALTTLLLAVTPLLAEIRRWWK